MIKFNKKFASLALAVIALSTGFSCQQVSAQHQGKVEANKTVVPGQKAPDFELKDENGKSIKLSDFSGKKVVVFFYDKDTQPTTKQEHKTIQKNYDKYKLAGVDVLCIGPDPVASHKAMNTQLNLTYHLLSDKDDKVRTLYGLPPVESGERCKYGIVIDGTGTVKKVAHCNGNIDDSFNKDLLDFVNTGMTGSGI